MTESEKMMSSVLLQADFEKCNFEQELQNFNIAMHGMGAVQLVVNITPAQAAYAHFLEIGSRDFSNSSQRWNTILRELSAEEFVRILPFIRNANYAVGLQKGETYV